jgi:choline dehydrogenase-like flavoprotein
MWIRNEIKSTPCEIWRGAFTAWRPKSIATKSFIPATGKPTPTFFVDERENPYTTPEHKPFYWTRGRQVGGKSHTWGGITLRLSDYEFKAAQRDGFGEDWPIAHADLAPYYSRLEKFFQVRGARDGLAQLPDGEYLSPSPLTPREAELQTLVSATGLNAN